MQFSPSCNPDWSDGKNHNGCLYWARYCNIPAYSHAYYRSQNADGIYETALQCPECGCSEENGALNLNDIKRNGYRKEQLAFFVAQKNAKTTTMTTTTISPTIYSDSYEYTHRGQAMQFSRLCNPDWTDGGNRGGCSYWVRYCHVSARTHTYLRTQNADGIYETALQCPQCGCSEENGALNLNDIYQNGYTEEQLAFFATYQN